MKDCVFGGWNNKYYLMMTLPIVIYIFSEIGISLWPFK
jgi:hypothetical protein